MLTTTTYPTGALRTPPGTSAAAADDTREDLPAPAGGTVRYPNADVSGTAGPFLRAALASHPDGHLTLDLSAVRAIDGSGLLALVELARACRARGGTLALAAPAPGVRALLAAVGMHGYADILPSPSRPSASRAPRS